MNASDKINLLNFNREGLTEFFTKMGEKPFRAVQIIKWVHQLGVTDFDAMTNLSLTLREYLKENAVITLPEIIQEQKSKDGTRKWLLQLEDKNKIETVFIPEENRGTLCLSSQVGCLLNCSFCATATLGFKRNLTIAEIIGQLWLAIKQFSTDKFANPRVITNVVMMGMGEPLLNFDNVVAAMDLMMDDDAYGLSKYRVTLSTAGIVPEMWRLREMSEVSLAVSLHAPNDELRSELMPNNKKYPLKELMAVCREYFTDSRRAITFEYTMLGGVNDTPNHARQLIKLLRGIRCKINLIPFNPFLGTKYKRSNDTTIEQFREILVKAEINTIIRKTRGDDIAAACGQLVGAHV